jgi:hypothetical protein
MLVPGIRMLGVSPRVLLDRAGHEDPQQHDRAAHRLERRSARLERPLAESAGDQGAHAAVARFASDGGGERGESMARFETTPFRLLPEGSSMSEKPNWHDAHALMLIDQALKQGTFTAELVAQINQALAAARQADPTIDQQLPARRRLTGDNLGERVPGSLRPPGSLSS